MKKILYTFGTCLLMGGLACAATISVTDFEQTDTGASGFAITVAADGNDWLFSFSRTADLDGLGTNNDTLTFDLRSSAFTGSSYSDPDLTLGTPFDYSVGGTLTTPSDQHFGPNGDIDNNQSFQLSIENIVFTQGEGLGWEATFDGFNQMGIFANPNGAQTFYIGTVGAEVVMPAGSNYTLSSPQQVLTVTSAQNSKRIRDVDFSFTAAEAIPELSSAALLGLGAIGLLIRRRR